MVEYRRKGELVGEWGFSDALRAVACDRRGNWYLAGDREVLVFSEDRRPWRRWATSRPGWSLAVAEDGAVWVGEPGQIEIFSAEGQLMDTWADDELFRLVTTLALSADEVFAGDAGSRWVHRFDLRRRLVNHIGDHHRKGGFHIPNGVLDFALDLDGTVVVANPGMHRVERYAPDGEPLGWFGRFGQNDPAGFPGCCNPTNLALGPEGRVVVSEKAGPRVKVYDREGTLLTVVAGAGDFDPAAKNMDLAVDDRGAIAVVDTAALRLAMFEPVAAGVAG